ncbi:MAG: exonuclease domain-containing protein [Oscillospiraceae bacterium]|nr:exonuclease domain-containing protein [Oscillospiraceae bacterium]
MIVMDLEWNRSYDKKPVDEILQIGAVRTDGLTGVITDTFNVYIKPVIHKKFDMGARKLPDLDLVRASDISFRTAWADFLRWCGDESEFAFWGPDDELVIKRNCDYYGIEYTPFPRVWNLQRAFSHAYDGTGKNEMALYRVVTFLGIPDVFDYHNALNDAMYTALVGKVLRREDLEFIPAPKPKRPRRRRRPKESLTAKPPETAVKTAKPHPRRRRPRRKTPPRTDNK